MRQAVRIRKRSARAGTPGVAELRHEVGQLAIGHRWMVGDAPDPRGRGRSLSRCPRQRAGLTGSRHWWAAA